MSLGAILIVIPDPYFCSAPVSVAGLEDMAGFGHGSVGVISALLIIVVALLLLGRL